MDCSGLSGLPIVVPVLANPQSGCPRSLWMQDALLPVAGTVVLARRRLPHSHDDLQVQLLSMWTDGSTPADKVSRGITLLGARSRQASWKVLEKKNWQDERGEERRQDRILTECQGPSGGRSVATKPGRASP